MPATNDSRPPPNQPDPVEDDAVADGHKPDECDTFPLESDRVNAMPQTVVPMAELAVTADTANTTQLDNGIPTAGLHVNGGQALTHSDMTEVDVSAGTNIHDIENQLHEGNRHDNAGGPSATTRLTQAELMREMARLDDEFHAAYLAGSNMPIWDQETRPAAPTASDVVLELRARNAALREQLNRQNEAMDRMSEIYLAFGELTNAWVNAVTRDVAAHSAGPADARQ
ncbi:hypothetical protein FN846DRAFT_886201 [Sphaerosporella brunnea]|uniref:Uncharacterized protein n=1 Tax=Sphaerosporella brunnea TaxID=1250544 RepID=A0A5J5FAG7_9PEZI|nr:hypothetical protein FN846DRAFT_886201 [Sphaerosporella brunnea]